MPMPPPLVRLIRTALVQHYRHHHADDVGRAEIFAASFADQLLGLRATTEANRAADRVDILELPYISSGAEENYRLAGILRENLCREIRRWLVDACVWRYSADLKALAFARAIANAADAGTYATAVRQAKWGAWPTSEDDDGVPDHERAAIEAERRYREGRGRW